MERIVNRRRENVPVRGVPLVDDVMPVWTLMLRLLYEGVKWCMTRVPSDSIGACGGLEPSLERLLAWSVLVLAMAMLPDTVIMS